MMVLILPAEDVMQIFAEKTDSASITEWARQSGLNKRTLTKIINGVRVQTRSMKKLADFVEKPLSEISRVALVLAI